MKPILILTFAAAGLAGCAQMVHVTPGTSVELALARKPEVIRMPESMLVHNAPHTVSARLAYIKPVEPDLPTTDSVTAVAEAFTRGKEALGAGRTGDAITAYSQAVELDPSFGDAWQQLAVAYEKAGKPGKAKDAFRHYKNMATR
jgi:tetratricopeptide (TPR) repeat protein